LPPLAPVVVVPTRPEINIHLVGLRRSLVRS
jgi:hypothetical protein